MNHKFEEQIVKLITSDWHKTDSLEELSKIFRSEFLLYASETPDNLECTRKIEIGKFSYTGDKRNYYGLKIAKKNISLTEIMHNVEGLSLPSEVKEYLPKLTEKEWKAAMRAVVIILTTLEKIS